MKFHILRKIISERAEELKTNAAYQGAWDDGGSKVLLIKLEEYKENWIYKLDLKPSEFYRLNDVEVGEPIEFKKVIEEYKTKLTKNITL